MSEPFTPTSGVYACHTSVIRAGEQRMIAGEELEWSDVLTVEEMFVLGVVIAQIAKTAPSEAASTGVFISMIDVDAMFIVTVDAESDPKTIELDVSVDDNITQGEDQ